MNRTEALKVRNSAFTEIGKWFQKKFKQKISKGNFKRVVGSSMYSPHQNQREMQRRVRQFPSLDLAKMGH